MTRGDWVYQDALTTGPAPELFPGGPNGGTLPTATASGLDPAELAAAPWWCRPAIAEAPTTAEASGLLATALDDPDAAEAYRTFTGTDGYAGFAGRVDEWVTGGSTASVQREQDARYEAARAARAAARTAAAAPRPEPTDDETYAAVFAEADQRREQLRASRNRGGAELRGWYEDPAPGRGGQTPR